MADAINQNLLIFQNLKVTLPLPLPPLRLGALEPGPKLPTPLENKLPAAGLPSSADTSPIAKFYAFHKGAMNTSRIFIV